jgi:hypothetical protein
MTEAARLADLERNRVSLRQYGHHLRAASQRPRSHGRPYFCDRFSKMVHLAPVLATVTAKESAAIFVDIVFRHHGLPVDIMSDRDPRFTLTFWTCIFELLGSRLRMSIRGPTERSNRVFKDVLRSHATSYASWSEFLPMVEFALNNSVHTSYNASAVLRQQRAPSARSGFSICDSSQSSA